MTGSSPWVKRAAAGAGLLIVLAHIFLGAVWPSIFTITGLVTLPAAWFLAVKIIKPDKFGGHASYISFSVILSILAIGYEIWYLNGGCEAVGNCL